VIERNMETLAQIAAACSETGFKIANAQTQDVILPSGAVMREQTARHSVLLALAICAELDRLLEKAKEGGAL
jgi:hypothetical protein